MNAAYGALAANLLLLVAGQLLWKVALLRAQAGPGPIWWQVAGSPLLWAGLGVYGLATVLWLYVLSRLPLSLAYPIQALAYLLGMVFAHWLLREPVPPLGWLGGLLILLGVGLVTCRPGL